MNEGGPNVLAMVALVAIVVALVILVFFALGYLFGRAFLLALEFELRRGNAAEPSPVPFTIGNMLLPGVFGIENDALNTGVNVLILVLVVMWAAMIFWTYADARRRIDDPMLIACATAASLFPFIGTIVYLIVRPPEFLDDVRLRELEMHAAEARLTQIDYRLCPHCDYEIKEDYLRCPSCMRRLKERCPTCAKPIDPSWKLCPYCEAEIGAVPTPSARRARRATETAAVEAQPRSQR